MDKFADLRRRLADKDEELLTLLADLLHYGSLSKLDIVMRYRLTAELEDFVDEFEESLMGPQQWERAIPANAKSSLEKLLAERHGLTEAILDIPDEAGAY